MLSTEKLKDDCGCKDMTDLTFGTGSQNGGLRGYGISQIRSSALQYGTSTNLWVQRCE